MTGAAALETAPYRRIESGSTCRTVLMKVLPAFVWGRRDRSPRSAEFWYRPSPRGWRWTTGSPRGENPGPEGAVDGVQGGRQGERVGGPRVDRATSRVWRSPVSESAVAAVRFTTIEIGSGATSTRCSSRRIFMLPCRALSDARGASGRGAVGRSGPSGLDGHPRRSMGFVDIVAKVQDAVPMPRARRAINARCRGRLAELTFAR